MRLSILRRRRLEHRQNGSVFDVRRCDRFEVRADAAQFRSDKGVHEMQPAIKPGEYLVLDFVMHGQSHFRAARADFRKINEPHQVDVATDRFKTQFILRIAFDREQDSMSLETERTAKTEVNGLGRGDGRFRHHQELATIRLNAGQTSFALAQRLAHVQGFFE